MAAVEVMLILQCPPQQLKISIGRSGFDDTEVNLAIIWGYIRPPLQQGNADGADVGNHDHGGAA